ncbi:MAG: AbrB/MazE/SpoVT family DNA-binding domain-containing protein, partial [Spirulina sp.]
MGNSSMITQTVKKWGNSLGINLPQSIAQQLDIKEGTVVKISAEGNKIILTTARSKYT